MAAGLKLEFLLTLVNVFLLFGLSVLFLQQWRQTRAKFSLGLVLFAGILFLRELLTVLRVLGRAEGLPVVGGQFGAVLALGEAVALGILLWNVAR